MSVEENKEDIKKRYKIEIIKFLENFWKLKRNSLPEGMPQKMTYYKRNIKHLVNILSEENAERKEKLIKLRKKKKMKKSTSTKTMNYLSENANKILNKIGRNIGKIKNSITDITKMNGLYLEQNARKTLSTYRLQRNNLEKLNLKKENLLENFTKRTNGVKYKANEINYNKTQRIDGYNKIRKLNILNEINNRQKETEKSKKEKYMKNFLFVNDIYRKQLNYAFLKYNPEKHLDDLKLLVEVEPLIRRDISTIKKEVEEDIKFRCDKNHFKKKYELIKKRFQRSNSVQNTPKGQLNKRNILPDLNKKKAVKVFTPKFSEEKKIINTYEIKKKEENTKIVFPKEEKIEEINYILKASSEIGKLIKDENINKKIDLYRTNYDEKLRLNEFYDTDSINLLEKDYFEEEKKSIINKLGDIYQFQLDKIINDKEKKIKGKIVKENDSLTKKLKEEKTNDINEINDIIFDNTLL